MSLCYDFSKWTMVSLASIAISLTLGLVLLSMQYAHGQTTNVKNSYFSIDVPDNWTYIQGSRSYTAQLLGFGITDSVNLTPNEFSVLHLNATKPLNEKMKDEGAFASFAQKSDYQIKNAPLDLFVKDQIDKQDGIQLTSRQNATIDNEKAVKIYADGINSFSGIKFVEYMMMHDKEPYYIGYMGNVKDSEKYLPEFEQIVSTFRFADKK